MAVNGRPRVAIACQGGGSRGNHAGSPAQAGERPEVQTTPMDFIWFIISTIISGLIIGALGRLAVPGPNPMSIGQTILIGIAGAFIGGLIAFLIGAPVGIAFILEILAAAAIIYFMQRRPNRVL